MGLVQVMAERRDQIGRSVYAIKAAGINSRQVEQCFLHQKTMYGGKKIAAGDEIFVFASENNGRSGLVAKGTVVSAEPVPERVDTERVTPRVSIVVRITHWAERPAGRRELRDFRDWRDGRPETELNFKCYRQATNKIAGISASAAAFLDTCFPSAGRTVDE